MFLYKLISEYGYFMIILSIVQVQWFNCGSPSIRVVQLHKQHHSPEFQTREITSACAGRKANVGLQLQEKFLAQ